VAGEPLGSELADLWSEYEDQATPVARIVRDIDKFEMLAQAYEYEAEHLRPCGTDPLQDSRTSATAKDAAAASCPAPPPPRSIVDEPLRDFFHRQQGKMKSPIFQRLDKELRERRKAMLSGKGWGVTDGEM
jgi:HD domain